MILAAEDMLRLLRQAVNVEQEGEEDPEYLAMSDEDLLLFLKLGASRAYPDCEDLSDLPGGAEYPVVLLAKIELYMKLAVSVAPKVDLGADNNNYIKLDQRFQHYWRLAQHAKDQYDSWLENEGEGAGSGGVTSYEVLLDSRHYARRNYELQPRPVVRLYVDDASPESACFRWEVSKSSHFGCYKAYISESQIVDGYADVPRESASRYAPKVSDSATLLLSTHDRRNAAKRVTGLKPGTTYHFAVLSIERNQVWGYAEKEFTTPPLEEEVDVSDLGEVAGNG